MSVNYDRVCRLCLSSRGETLPIFSSTSSDDADPPLLATKIHECVSVQITEDDGLPTQVCKKCVANVNNWHAFKKICSETQTKLNKWFKNDEKEEDEDEEDLHIKREPSQDEACDDGLVIDANYPEFNKHNNTAKLQPEGPPILASLGLAPRTDKDGVSEKEEDEEVEEEEEEEFEGDDAGLGEAGASAVRYPNLPSMPEVSVTVMKKSGATFQSRQGIQQLASKNCLVCARSYRYSHNARRHELTAHNFDRYTNKVTNKNPHLKLRPNPFNPKARLMPNPINPKIQFMPKAMPKSRPKSDESLPFPLRIKALSDLQIKRKEPEILKSLLTTQPEMLVSEPEIMNSGSESPETLISEPEISSFHVEAIISEPDAYDPNEGEIDEGVEANGDVNQNHHTSIVDIESDNEIEITTQPDATVDEAEKLEETENEEVTENEHQKVDDGAETENGEPEEIEGEAGAVEDDQEEGKEDEVKQEDDIEINENGLAEHEQPEDDDNDDNEASFPQHDDEMEDEDDDLPPMPLAPIVEIQEGDAQVDSFSSEINDEDESAELNETLELKEPPAPSTKTLITKTQRDFILKYRDIIEQINTKKCVCCDRVHARRKAVIQHLQKNGHKVPKHTCYNCVVTFGHIGALLSHMRANVCTNLWTLIYSEGGITEDMIVEDVVAPSAEYPGQTDTLNKVQYKDILNARSYACKLCPAKFQLKQFIMKHVLDVHEDGQSRVPLACVHCGYRFKENRLWKKHVRNGECTVHISCDLCPEKFISMLDFNEHALAVHAGGFVDQSNESQSKCVDGRPTDCPICHKNTSSYHNLVKHLKSIHNEERPHYCQHCDAKFEVIAEINQHIYLEHSDRSAASQMPDISIVKEEAEEYHYSCTECNGIFETVDAWTDHQVAEHGQIAHHCDQCEKKFLNPAELEEHKNTHLRVKFYSCTVCPNSYGTPERLAEHMRATHPGTPTGTPPGEDPFFCEVCVRSFKSRQAYSNHMRIHSKVPTTNRKAGEPKRMYPVPTGKIANRPHPLAQPGGYLQFKPTYNNIPNAPYSCDICGKGFMHKKNIWKHKKVLHADVVGDRNIDSEENTRNTMSTEGDEEYQDDNSTGLSIPQFDSFSTDTAVPTVGKSHTVASPNPAFLYQCDLCVKKFSVKASLWKHKRVKHGIINPNPNDNSEAGVGSDTGRSSCTLCKITFSDKKSYYRHRKNVHKSNIQMCKICGKPLNSTLELYEHLKAAHARELLGYNANQGNSKAAPEPQPSRSFDYASDGPEVGPETGGTDAYQARYPCDTCGKYFLGMLALQNHQCLRESADPETFDCEICHKSYTSISALKSHRGWHLRSPDGKAAANNSGLWMPQHKVTNKISKHEVLETIPPIRFHSTPNALAMTKRKLPPEVEVTVVNPNKKPRSEDSFEGDPGTHLQPRLPGEDRYCTLCDKEFTKKAAYQRHMEEVHQPNSVFCPVCNKSFTRKSTLLVHMRKHYEGDPSPSGSGSGIPISNQMTGTVVTGPPSDAGSEPDALYPCDLCGAQYRSSKLLRVHRVRHHGEEDTSALEEEEAAATAPPAAPGEFTCAQCGDGVATPRDLLAHRQMHSTPTKFFCNVCKVYFAKAVDLSSHTRARHSDNDKVFFPCAMCDRFYMNKKSLQRHIEMAH